MLKKLFYQFIALSLLSGCFALASWGSSITTPQSPLYPYQSSIMLQEDFLTGTNTSGTIGDIGMGAANGTVSNVTSIANRYGILGRSTGTTANTVTTLVLSSKSGNMYPMSAPADVTWIIRLNDNDSDTTQRVGISSDPTVDPPSNGAYLEKLTSDTNYFCVSRASSVETRTNSGIAVNTSFRTFRVNRQSSSVQYFIDNTLVCTHSTNLPTIGGSAMTHIVNATTTSKSQDIDYFQVIFSGLTR